MGIGLVGSSRSEMISVIQVRGDGDLDKRNREK